MVNHPEADSSPGGAISDREGRSPGVFGRQPSTLKGRPLGYAHVVPQSLANVLIHVVFSTQGRRPVLHGGLREETFAYLGGVLKNDGSAPLCVGGYEDHVHLLFRLSRTRTLAETLGTAKAASSRWIKTKDPRLGEFALQAGYAAFSVGRSEVETVSRYIRDQAEHHVRLGFQDEMRAFFERYEIPCDERYVWD